MGGMFDGFKNPSTDIPENIKPKPPEKPGCDLRPCPPPECGENPHLKPYKPNIPFEDYNAHGELIGYWWYEGDQLNLEFNIEGEVVIGDSEEYVTAEDFVKDKTITLKIYNFRREELIHIDYEGATTITFEIDDKITKIFKKGVYYCSLDLWNGNSFNRTIYMQENCTLTVK